MIELRTGLSLGLGARPWAGTRSGALDAPIVIGDSAYARSWVIGPAGEILSYPPDPPAAIVVDGVVYDRTWVFGPAGEVLSYPDEYIQTPIIGDDGSIIGAFNG